MTAPTVANWVAGKKPIPSARCPDIERYTDGQVTCESLRPDVDWGYLRGGTPRRIDTPEAAAALLGVARAVGEPADVDLPLDAACDDPDDALQPGEMDPPGLDPDDPDYDPDADRLGPAVETA